MILIDLAVLLAALMAPPIRAADVKVAFVEMQHGGVACHSMFREVEGNVQHLCDGLPDRTILINETAYIHNPKAMLNAIAHEVAHFSLPPVEGATAFERFREREAHKAGCAYQWIPACRTWLGETK